MRIFIFWLVLFGLLLTLLAIGKNVKAREYSYPQAITVTSDSEKTETTTILTGISDVTKDNWNLSAHTGLFRTTEKLGSSPGTSSFNITEIRASQWTKGIDVETQLRVFSNKNWSTVTGHVYIGSMVTNRIYVSGVVSSGLIDTIRGFETQLTSKSMSGMASYSFDRGITIDGTISQQSFSDNNNRRIVTGIFIMPIAELSGLSVRLKYKKAEADFNSPAWFSPEAWVDKLIGVNFYRRMHNQSWSTRSNIWVGKQKIDDARESNLIAGNLNIMKKINKRLSLGGAYGWVGVYGDYDYSWHSINAKATFTF